MIKYGLRQIPPPPPNKQTATVVGGTHPTGMNAFLFAVGNLLDTFASQDLD